MYRTCDIFGNSQNMPVPRDQQWHMNNSRNNNPHGGFFRHQPYTQSYYGGPSGNTFNNEYWCETCDRGFRTELILENHKKQHQKCNIDGCQFIAHPKVITKHIQMQHSTGLYKKISKLNNPEEIQKWREERRKKYPTKCNIEKKNSENQEKLDRGEKMGMGSLKKNRETFSRRNRANESSRKDHKILKRNFPKKSEKQTPSSKIVKFQTDTAERRHLKPFAGIQQLIEDTNDNDGDSSPEMARDLIEDCEFVEDVINPEKLEAKPVVCGALVSLINDYGLTDEEEVEEVIKESSTKLNNIGSTHNNIVTEDKRVNNENTSLDYKDTKGDDSGPEEIKVVKNTENNHTEDNISEIKNKRKPHNKQHKNEKSHNKTSKNMSLRRKLPSTLLEKLLSNEIRKERNIVLQCIRHVIRNNFFDECEK